MTRGFLFFCSLGLALTLPVAFAEDQDTDEALPSVLSLNYGADVDGGQNVFVNTNLSVNRYLRFTLAYGDSRQDSNVSVVDLDTKTYLAGLTFVADPEFSAGFEYEYWGEEDSLITKTSRLLFDMDISDWTFSVAPEMRTNTVYYAQTSKDVDSKAVALNLGYYGWDKLSFSVGYTKYDYDKDVSKLDLNLFRLIQLGRERALAIATLQNATDDHVWYTEASYYAQAAVLGVNWAQTVNAIDNSKTYVTSGFVSTEITSSWVITLTAGWQEDIENDRSEFANVGLSYYWD
jgi:hypothetical protein